MRATLSELRQIGIEKRDGFDTAEIVFEGDVFVRSVGILVGQAEAHEDAGDLENVVHLGDERNGAAFANEGSFLVKPLFQSAARLLKNRMGIRRDPWLARAQDVEFAMDGLG